MDKKRIAILGSTGSIGVQALQVIDLNRDLYDVDILTARSQSALLIKQALEFAPRMVVIGEEEKYMEVSSALKGLNIRVCSGKEAITAVVREYSPDIVLNALVGFAGLLPSLAAAEGGGRLCLANKESLVVAGQLLVNAMRHGAAGLVPVDSEHSAIYQCLQGEKDNTIAKLYLTASGGPFRGSNREFLARVSAKQALAHPTWKMGAKISIDSATMMNKGLEVIEARWLFDVQPEKINVVVHPESVVHSMVEFIDGSVKALLSPPDMRYAILYALNAPERRAAEFPRLDFGQKMSLTFEPPDTQNFRNLALAYEALKRGGNAPCVLNAANEIAVQGFLEGRIGFLRISDIVERCLAMVEYLKKPDIDDLVETDRIARIKAMEAFSHV